MLSVVEVRKAVKDGGTVCVCVCRAKHLIFDLTRLLGRWKMQRERSCDCLS